MKQKGTGLNLFYILLTCYSYCIITKGSFSYLWFISWTGSIISVFYNHILEMDSVPFTRWKRSYSIQHVSIASLQPWMKSNRWAINIALHHCQNPEHRNYSSISQYWVVSVATIITFTKWVQLTCFSSLHMYYM
jgi:hypothetical protein